MRFATGESQELKPFPDMVDERFEDWMAGQEMAGHRFTPEQREWLEMIKGHIATSLSIGMDDLELAPFYERGGLIKADKLFGRDLSRIMNELNEALAG